MDAIPVASQVKSLVQYSCGQKEQAKETQRNFSRRCPVVSQVRSAIELARGDREAAKQTQFEFVQTVGSFVDGIPVIGHTKGLIHYVAKDREGGDDAMKSASHSTAVVAGGVGGFVIGGPVGAIAGGVVSGAAIDVTITGVDSVLHKKYRPYGALLEAVKDLKDSGKWCDFVFATILDGIVGRSAGVAYPKIKQSIKNIAKPSTGVVSKIGTTEVATSRVMSSQLLIRKLKAFKNKLSCETASLSIPSTATIVQRALSIESTINTIQKYIDSLNRNADTATSILNEVENFVRKISVIYRRRKVMVKYLSNVDVEQVPDVVWDEYDMNNAITSAGGGIEIDESEEEDEFFDVDENEERTVDEVPPAHPSFHETVSFQTKTEVVSM